jgi:hypothetical protein
MRLLRISPATFPFVAVLIMLTATISSALLLRVEVIGKSPCLITGVTVVAIAVVILASRITVHA